MAGADSDDRMHSGRVAGQAGEVSQTAGQAGEVSQTSLWFAALLISPLTFLVAMITLLLNVL